MSITRLILPAWVMLNTVVGASLVSQNGSLQPASQGARPSPYFGQPLPTVLPERFAPGVVSTDDAIELNGVFAPDLKEFFFARLVAGGQTMFHSELVDGVWTVPRELLLFPGQTRAVADDMALSPDGRELYFLGSHPGGVGATDIWRSRRVDGKWSTAEVLLPPINTNAGEVYPVVVGDGSLYFTSSRAGGIGPRSSLYRAQRLKDGSFAPPLFWCRRRSTANSESVTPTSRLTRAIWCLGRRARRVSEVVTSSSPSGGMVADGASLSLAARG